MMITDQTYIFARKVGTKGTDLLEMNRKAGYCSSDFLVDQVKLRDKEIKDIRQSIKLTK